MKSWIVAGLLVSTTLCGCQDSSSPAGAKQGRYQGAGHYAPGDVWRQIVRQAPKDATSATPADDEQVIVVVDSVTGEVRQCGNLSGFCISMNPWTKALPQTQTSPLPLGKHAAQLEAEARAQAADTGH